jgi:hypothetical protein
MISDLAYKSGASAAWGTFMKSSGATPRAAIHSFTPKPKLGTPAGAPLGAVGSPVAPAPAAAVAPPAAAAPPVAPIKGGAAAPAAAPAAAAPAAAAAGGGWKGFARDAAVQMAVPIGMMGLQKIMEPSQKDPNAT